MKLEALARRVLGVLLEKEATTPGQYPLSLNSLTNACNQKSNRQPLMNATESEVQTTLRELYVDEWVTNVTQANSRILKWKHRVEDKLDLRGKPLAVLAELLLRGPQQPGELRARASRIVPIPDLPTLELVADTLSEAGLLKRRPPQPGERSGRYDHNLYIEEASAGSETRESEFSSPDPESSSEEDSQALNPSTGALVDEAPPATGTSRTSPGEIGAEISEHDKEQRIATLEALVSDLQQRLSRLEADLGGSGDAP